jgi:hypothetical protein
MPGKAICSGLYPTLSVGQSTRHLKGHLSKKSLTTKLLLIFSLTQGTFIIPVYHNFLVIKKIRNI